MTLQKSINFICCLIVLSLFFPFLPIQKSIAEEIKRDDDRLEIQYRQNKENLSELERYLDRTIPVDPWQGSENAFSFEEKDDEIVVITKTAKLVFSKQTCNITQSTILGTPLGNIKYPNLVIHKHDKIFTQNNSKEGILSVIDEADFFTIKGTFTLTAEDGEEVFTWNVSYKICKDNGYTIVTYTNPSDEIKVGKYFSIEHKFNQIDRHGIDQLALGCGGIENENNWWIPWSERHMRDKDEIYTDKHMLNLVLMGNGRIGIASEPPTEMNIFNIDENQSGYLKAETVSGARSFAWIIVNQPTTSGVAVGVGFPDEVQYTLCFYPMREYRSAKHMYFPSYWTSGEQMGYLGSDLTENLDSGNRHTKQMNEEIQKYGGKVIFMAPNWEITQDTTEQLHYFSKPITWGGENARQQCWTCSRFQKRFFEYLMIETMLRESGDGARLDCSLPGWCNNPAHGCDKRHSFYSLSLFESMRQLRKDYNKLENQSGNHYIIGACVSSYPSVNAYSDWVCSGEGNAGYPSQMVSDLHFNSLLYGRDFTLLVGGNSPVDADKPRIYTQMIERCGTVCFHLHHPTSTHRHASMWKKYFNPLHIFNVKEAEIHHPLHYDYKQYVANSDNRLPIIVYSKIGKSLAVLCNRAMEDEQGILEINTNALNIKNNNNKVLLFEVNTKTSRICNIDKDGWLRTNVSYPKQYDTSFILIRQLPDTPEVIWSSVTTKNISNSFKKQTITINAQGLPGLDSRLFIYCPESMHPSNSNISAFDRINKIAYIDFKFDEKGKATLRIDFSTNNQTESLSTIQPAINSLNSLWNKIDSLNYTYEDTQELKKVCMLIRNNTHLVENQEQLRKLLENTEDAERLLFCQEKIIECPDKVRGLPQWSSRDKKVTLEYVEKSGAIPMNWAVIGPFSNNGFEKLYPVQNDLSMSNEYTGKNDEKISWKKITGFYIDFGYCMEPPRMGPVENVLRDMIAFAQTTIICPEDIDAVLNYEAEGSLQLWLNDKEIAINKTEGSNVVIPLKQVSIKLKKGKNFMLLKSESGGKSWIFKPVIKDQTGKTIQNIKFQTQALPLEQSPYAHAFFINTQEVLKNIAGLVN